MATQTRYLKNGLGAVPTEEMRRGSGVLGDDIEDLVELVAVEGEPLFGVDRPQLRPILRQEVGDQVGGLGVDRLQLL